MDKQTLSLLIPVLGISIGLIYAVAWPLNNWLRMRYGHAPEAWDEEAEKIKQLKERVLTLESQVAKLSESREHLANVEDRLRILERIITDPAQRLAAEIDQLAQTPSGRE